MTDTQWIIITVGFFGCLGISFFLSGMETGLAELSRLRLRRRVREGNARAVRLQEFVDQPEETLWTILVGNTVANLLAMLTALTVLQHWMEIQSTQTLISWSGQSAAYWGAFLAYALAFFTVCELLPKMVFRRYPDTLCLALARLFGLVHLACSPLVSILESVSRLVLTLTGGRELRGHLFGSREELRQMMSDSGQALTEDERKMIDHVLDLQKFPVRDLAVPMDELPTITTETSVREIIEQCTVEAYSRLPVWRDDGRTRRIVGVINLRRLVFMPEHEWHRPAKHFVESALYQDEDIRLQKLLNLMQRSGQRVVIILDKRKRELGIVSLPDILRTVFGEVKV